MARHTAPRQGNLETLDGILRPKPDRGANTLPEILRQAHDGTRPDRQTAEIQIRILRSLSRTDGVRLLSHAPRQRPRHRRDHPRGMTQMGKGQTRLTPELRNNAHPDQDRAHHRTAGPLFGDTPPARPKGVPVEGRRHRRPCAPSRRHDLCDVPRGDRAVGLAGAKAGSLGVPGSEGGSTAAPPRHASDGPTRRASMSSAMAAIQAASTRRAMRNAGARGRRSARHGQGPSPRPRPGRLRQHRRERQDAGDEAARAAVTRMGGGGTGEGGPEQGGGSQNHAQRHGGSFRRYQVRNPAIRSIIQTEASVPMA